MQSDSAASVRPRRGRPPNKNKEPREPNRNGNVAARVSATVSGTETSDELEMHAIHESSIGEYFAQSPGHVAGQSVSVGSPSNESVASPQSPRIPKKRDFFGLHDYHSSSAASPVQQKQFQQHSALDPSFTAFSTPLINDVSCNNGSSSLNIEGLPFYDNLAASEGTLQRESDPRTLQQASHRNVTHILTIEPSDNPAVFEFSVFSEARCGNQVRT